VNFTESTKWLYVIAFSVLLIGCKGSEVLAPSPNALDLDHNAPICPGLTSLGSSLGPALTLTWGEATDDLSAAASIKYNIYMKSGSGNYDKSSPTKIVLGQTSTVISSGVLLGQTYTVYVSCVDQAGNESPLVPTNEKSITVINTTPPTKITDLQAISPTYTSILLNWSPSDDGVGGTASSLIVYKVYGSKTSPVSTSGTPLTTVIGKTSFLHAGLNAYETWYYKVTASDAWSNISADSNEASNQTVNDVSPPMFSGNSAGLVMTANTTSSVTISWNAASDNVTPQSAIQYRIYRCSSTTTCNPFSQSSVAASGAGLLTYTDNGLSSSTSYVYGVRAVDTRNNVSVNTDTKLFSTAFDSVGAFYAYPTLQEAGMQFGRAVAVANVIGAKDGTPNAYPDLIVGAPLASEPAPTGRYRNTGCIYIYAGIGPGQFSQTASQVICSPGATADGNNPNLGQNFGFTIIAADFDGNGTTDLFVTSPNRQTGWFFLTQDDGTGTLFVDTSAIYPLVGTSASWGVGGCASEMKGVNKGGADLVITAPTETCSNGCGLTGTGNVYVYKNTSVNGGFSPPSTPVAAPWTGAAGQPTSFFASSFTVTNNEQVARKCSIGKFDSRAGHQSDNVLILSSGQSNQGASLTADGALGFYRVTYAGNAFSLSPQNVVTVGSTTVPLASQWGESIAGIQLYPTSPYAGPSIVVGALSDSSAGAANGGAYIYDLSVSVAGDFSLIDNGEAFYGASQDFNNNGIGASVYAYDLFHRANGVQDLIYGASLDDRTSVTGAANIDIGDVVVHKNLGNGYIDSSVLQTHFDFSAMNPHTNQLFGSSMCRGDLNGDGIEDVVIGSPNQSYDVNTITNNPNVGAVYIFHGKPTGEIDFTQPDQIIYGPGNTANAAFGMSCVVMDYNGDGHNDLVVGSPFRSIGGIANRGAVYIYHGSSVVGALLPTSNSATLTPPASVPGGINFGYSLAAGDFDGNGFNDLLIGAINAQYPVGPVSSVGKAFVYWADNTGTVQPTIPPSVLVPPSGAVGSGTNPFLANTITLTANTNFGYSVAVFPTRARWGSGRLGMDAVICAPGLGVAAGDTAAGSFATPSQGACFIYEGAVNLASGGAPANYTISASPENEIRHLDGAPYNDSRGFGYGMTVGKWNGDGADDLIVCAALARKGGTANVGACYSYFGNWDTVSNSVAGGFKVPSSYNANAGGTRFAPIHQDKLYNPFPSGGGLNTGYFGTSVLLTDINNNGSSDLMIGEPYSDSSTAIPSGGLPPTTLGKNSGRVYILRGGY
jgi:hypothetical protein